MSVDKIFRAYLCSIRPGESHDSEEKATKIISQALSGKWTEAQILHAIKNKHPRANFLKDILYTKENLVVPDKMYYHSELRILPPLPKSRIDEITGEIIYLNLYEDWKLEVVRVYTIYNLLMYYYGLFKINPIPQQVKRDIGAFKYLLTMYDIDQLLFIIDTAYGYMNDDDMPAPNTPFAMQDYIREGLTVYEEKVAYDRMVGTVGRR